MDLVQEEKKKSSRTTSTMGKEGERKKGGEGAHRIVSATKEEFVLIDDTTILGAEVFV